VFSALADLATGATDIIFPRLCAACGKKLLGESESKICVSCWSEIVFLRYPLCRICGRELAGDKERNHLCGACLRDPPPYLLARSVLRYTAPVQMLLYGLKYGSDTSVLPGVAELVSQFDMTPFDECDYVIPVPLHIKKLRRRGMNQSILLAKCIFSKKTQTRLRTDLLVRGRNTVSQTSLDGVQRRKNLAGAFVVVKKAALEKKVICLVDDVFTTGTTVCECSRILYKQGAKEVKVITLTRAELAINSFQLTPVNGKKE